MFWSVFEFLAKDGQGGYSLTPESAAFLVSTKPGFQGGLIRHTSEHLLPSWLHLNEVVATGRPVAAVNQQGPGSEFFAEFVNDILPMSYHVAQELAAHLNLSAAAGPVSVLDLAAGSGVWGIALAQSSSQVRVTAVDWHGVISRYPQHRCAVWRCRSLHLCQKAICFRRTSAAATTLQRSATFCTAKAGFAARLCSKRLPSARPRRNHRHRGVPGERRSNRPGGWPYLRRQHAGEHRLRRYVLL